jgi:16S rRNA (cytosine1407-C5)-methyltransferase
MKRKISKQVTPTIAVFQQALDRIQPLLSLDEWQQLQDELGKPLLPSLRLNPLKLNSQTIPSDWLERYQWQATPVAFCPAGYTISTPWRGEPNSISKPWEHRLGQYYIQDAASMLPVELFDPPPSKSPLVLDMAASPGGKTTHLSSRLCDHGLIIANDSSADRLTALRIVLHNWGAINTAIAHFPGDRFGEWFPDTFDMVLLDAPCSMQNLRSKDSHPMRSITNREENMLARRQMNLLDSALQTVKPGGQVVYSTCTLFPEEDEMVVNEILERWGNLVDVIDITSRLPVPAPGMSELYGRHLNPALSQAVRLWPHKYHTSGFFAVRLTKLEASARVVPWRGNSEPPTRTITSAGFQELSRQDEQDITAQLSDAYGLDLTVILFEGERSLWRRGSSIFVIPILYLSNFPTLPVQAIGLQIAEDTPDGYQMTHDWTTRFYPLIQTGMMTIPQQYVSAWLRGEDYRDTPPAFKLPGNTIIVTDEQQRLLGRGKLLADRVKNLLPRQLVRY